MLTLTDINRALDRLGVEAFIPRTRRKRPFTPDFGSSCRTCGDPMRRGPATTPFARADARMSFHRRNRLYVSVRSTKVVKAVYFRLRSIRAKESIEASTRA